MNYVLLEKVLPDGTKRVCDYRCYRHTGKCKCICGGLNHGVGAQEAIERTLKNRGGFESQGITVVVEDRLMFDTDPVREKKKRGKIKPKYIW